MCSSDLVLRLAIFRQAIGTTDRTLFESSYDALNDAAREALGCSPADSFVWLTLFWIDVARHGLQAENANYLRISYASGPSEAWIALWRNQLAFTLFDRLPADLADDAVGEFIKLVNTRQLYWQTGKIFENASPDGQHRITEHLKTADDVAREAFLIALHREGVDVAVPGQLPSEPRPWR